MMKTFVVCAALLLPAGCTTMERNLPSGGIDELIAKTIARTQAVCTAVPTAASIVAMFNSTPFTTFFSISEAICNAIGTTPRVGSTRSGRFVVMVHGVQVQGSFIPRK